MRTFALGLLGVCALSASLQASPPASYEFAPEDALFARRGESPEAAALATKAYQNALGQTVGEDKIYAAVQIGRLALLQGVIYEEKIPVEVRRKILESCIDSIDTIKGNRQEYYYFYLSCVGARGKIASNLIDKFLYARKMSNIQTAALKSTQDANGTYIGGFEAGGILRVMAAVRGNQQARAVGLYNPEEALQFATAAVASTGRYYAPFKEFISGQTYWDNYFYVGQAMASLAIEKEDKNLILQARQKMLSTLSVIQDLEDEGTLSTERQPEVSYYRTLMKRLIDETTACVNQSAWVSCLKKAMEG